LITYLVPHEKSLRKIEGKTIETSYFYGYDGDITTITTTSSSSTFVYAFVYHHTTTSSSSSISSSKVILINFFTGNNLAAGNTIFPNTYKALELSVWEY